MNTNRFNTVRGVALPLLLVMLAGATGCTSSSNSNPYESSDDDWGTPRSRPVLTADAQGRQYVEQRQVVYEEPTTITRTEQRTAAPRTTGMNTVTMAFPTGERSSSSLLVERTAPSEIVVGAPFRYTMKVTNLTDLTLNNVFVAETSDEGLEVTSSNVRPIEGTPWNNQQFNRNQNVQGFNQDNDNANNQANRPGRTWDVGTLGPNESKTIEVEARTEQAGAINTCVFAGFNPEVCVTMNAVAPALQIRVQAPSEALVCEDIPLRYSVTNTGTGTARDVRLTIPMTAGLRSTEGRESATMNLGDIAAGQTKEVTVNARADRTGSFTTDANAAGAMGLTAEAEQATFNVVQPTLTITVDTPDTQYLGRDIGSRVTVTNTSNVVARDVRVNADMSGNVRLVNEAGSAAGSSWNLGDLAPGEGKTTQLFYSMRETGTVNGHFTADARCAQQARSEQFTTRIVGIPALLLEVVDEADPIPIGQDTTYTIRVTNQGSSPATNIKITAMIPEQFELISARGAGETQEAPAAGGDRRFDFRPLGTLAPKATAEWRIRVKANGPGDVRFGTSLTADQLDSPVEETESTHLYR